MPDTALGITYPSSTSAVNVPSDMQVLAADVDALLTLLVSKPRFHVTQVAVAQNIVNATWTSVTFNTEALDSANGHDNAVNSSRYTVQAGHTGLWLVGAKHSWDGNTSGRRLHRFLINGATVVPGSEESVPPAATALLAASTSFIVSLTAGDYIESQQNQDSGTTRTTFNGTADSGAAFWGVRLSS